MDDAALSQATALLCAGAVPEVVRQWDASDLDSAGWEAVVGRPQLVEHALRRVIPMPEGTARFAVRPGAVTMVQLLPDRAVIVRLNDGHALSRA